MLYISIVYQSGVANYALIRGGISVISSIARLFSSILRGKIEDVTDLSEEQSKFRGGRSCLDSILSQRLVADKNLTGNKGYRTTFVD